MPEDCKALRDDLTACLPSLLIDQVAAESGQRVVYFGRFDDALIPEDIPADSPFLRGWEVWGKIVVKVVSGASHEALTRLEAESRILREVKPAQFPALRFANLFVDNPVTDDKLAQSLYVSIEEFVESQTLSHLLGSFVGSARDVARIALGIAEALEPLWIHPLAFATVGALVGEGASTSGEGAPSKLLADVHRARYRRGPKLWDRPCSPPIFQ